MEFWSGLYHELHSELATQHSQPSLVFAPNAGACLMGLAHCCVVDVLSICSGAWICQLDLRLKMHCCTLQSGMDRVLLMYTGLAAYKSWVPTLQALPPDVPLVVTDYAEEAALRAAAMLQAVTGGPLLSFSEVPSMEEMPL